MRHWAEFYTYRNGSFMEGVGDRSVIQLDGRWNMSNKMYVAKCECIKRGYDGYRIARGDSLLRLFYLTAAVIPITTHTWSETK